MSSVARLRRSPWIVSYWQSGRLIYENYLSRVRISADPLCTLVLDFFDTWRTPAGLFARLPNFSPASIRAALDRLAGLSFLEREGRGDPRGRAMQAWARAQWAPHAGLFHFATKDVDYRVEGLEDPRPIRRYIRRHPQPQFHKRYPGAMVIPLARPAAGQGSEFQRVLCARRTWREFSPQPLSLGQLAQLLKLTWGVTGHLETDLLGRLPLKTSPSAGARHPIEAYVVAMRVEGLRQGLYHYASDRHQLERIRSGPMKRRTIRYLGGQWWFGEAAAVFLMTAVFPRTMWKYDHPRAYRATLLDAGHLCQTFCLAATWLDLAPFCTAALADSLIESDVGADGVTESALYAAGVGVRPEQDTRAAKKRARARSYSGLNGPAGPK